MPQKETVELTLVIQQLLRRALHRFHIRVTAFSQLLQKASLPLVAQMYFDSGVHQFV